MRRAQLISYLMLCLAASGCTVRGPAHAALPPPAGGSDLNALLLWAVAVSFVGIAASVSAVIWLPTKKLALSCLAGFGAMLGCAIGVKVIQPYLGYIVLGAFILLVLAAAYAVWRMHLATRMAVAFGKDMGGAITDDDAQAVKDKHAVLQAAAGVKGIIDKVLARG